LDTEGEASQTIKIKIPKISALKKVKKKKDEKCRAKYKKCHESKTF
jgi:hypothetical protein